MNTIGDVIDHEHSISVACEGCHHTAQLDLEAIAAKLGRDHSYLAAALLPRLKCSRCGSKRLTMSLSGLKPGQGQPYPPNAYAKSKGG